LFFPEGEDPFDIPIDQTIPLSFTFDTALICPPGEDCTVEAQPSPGPVTFSAFQLPVPIDIVALTGDEELRDGAQRIKRVEIRSVDYEVRDNTMNIPTPAIDIYVNQAGATTKSGGVTIATIPTIAAGAKESGSSTVSVENRDAADSYFRSLKLALIPYAEPKIETGELFPPQGKADFDLKLQVRFTLNPVDAL
jgi:hypothetical protein